MRELPADAARGVHDVEMSFAANEEVPLERTESAPLECKPAENVKEAVKSPASSR